jgi:hypothetical protein
MGHLLGAAPTGPHANVTSIPPFVVTEVEIDSIQSEQPPPGIAAFAIDSPRDGARSAGEGVEVNGWVVGESAPVQGVRTVCGERASHLYPLDILRPDVAADYPAFRHAAVSGFSAWAPLAASSNGKCALEAILTTGETVTLARISGSVFRVRRCDWSPDVVPVTAPDFVIIGAQRGGTTSLHAYLSAHPQVHTPKKKELHFLTDRHERGLDWYLGQFPLAIPFGSITGEATPYALFHPLAPQRLREIAPHAKLIALLRNPVDRAYSHYLLEVARGFETLDFAAALDAEAARLAGEEARLIADPTSISEPHKHVSYLARGDYAPQLERWFAHIPREQFLVLRSEALYQRPAETFAQVATFLGVAPELDAPFTPYNQTSGPPLDPAIRARLAAHFAPKNAKLATLLGWASGWE